MAQNWYPVIDYLSCTECGVCVAKCPHNVYDTARVPTPVVLHSDGCIDHCHGCGDLCPQGAITYVGDNTGWQPPHGDCKPEPRPGEGGTSAEKRVIVQYLYLDLQICDRCIGTDRELDEVLTVLTPALNLAGFEVEYQKIEMKTAAIAAQHRFLSSPTIRVNGQDICKSVQENACGCCSEISGSAVDCRVFTYNGETYEVPPKEMLAEAVLRTVFSSPQESCSCGYVLPENLVAFFEGKQNKNCSCGGNCC